MNSLFDNDGQQQQGQQQYGQQYQQPPPQRQQQYQGGGQQQQYNNQNYGNQQQQYGHNSQQQDGRYNQNFNRRPYGVMPFGKHRGEMVVDLPVDYLVWLWWKKSGNPLRDPLRNLVMAALRRHNIDPMGPMPPSFDQPRNAGWNTQAAGWNQGQGQNNGGGDQWQSY